MLLHTLLELAEPGGALNGPHRHRRRRPARPDRHANESRANAVARMIVLLRQAATHGCDLVVFPECALTAFFPHWYYDRQDELDA